MIKGILHLLFFSIGLCVLHSFVVLPAFSITNKVPVIYQHLILGGFSVVIFLVTFFISKHFFEYTGYVVLGFLLLKMIFLGIFVNAYQVEIDKDVRLKYLLLGFYFVYLVFLLLKIIPLLNINGVNKTEKRA